jgi:hypothetical protein
MPPGTGRMIGEFGGRGIGRLFGIGLGTEVIYSFVIIVCSLMIYYGTKELYELSSHRGIKYFRRAFLFFAFAYFFRSFIKLIIFYFNVQGILQISPRNLSPIISQGTLFLFMYFSAMAIFYMLYSVIHKKSGEKIIYLFHALATVFAIFGVFSANPLSYLISNLLLFSIVLSVVFISYHSKTKNRAHNFYAIYVLLSFFWILNIIDILMPTFFHMYQILIYIFSLGIFLLILYKVIKKTGGS